MKNRYKDVIIKWLNVVKLNAYRFFSYEDLVEYRINMGCHELSICTYSFLDENRIDIYYVNEFGYMYSTRLMKFYINILYICGIEKIMDSRIKKLNENKAKI